MRKLVLAGVLMAFVAPEAAHAGSRQCTRPWVRTMLTHARLRHRFDRRVLAGLAPPYSTAYAKKLRRRVKTRL